YRKNTQKDSLEKALLANQIPFVVSGDVAILQRKAVRDMVALWRAAFLPWDNAAYRRILGSLKLGVTLDWMDRFMAGTGETMRQGLERLASAGGRKGERILELLDDLNALWRQEQAET